jgi:hypothetical protein
MPVPFGWNAAYSDTLRRLAAYALEQARLSPNEWIQPLPPLVGVRYVAHCSYTGFLPHPFPHFEVQRGEGFDPFDLRSKGKLDVLCLLGERNDADDDPETRLRTHTWGFQLSSLPPDTQQDILRKLATFP